MEDFFREYVQQALPDREILIYYTIPCILYTWGSAKLAGFLHTRKEVRVAYTRKVFHFLIFSMAGLLYLYKGLNAVYWFGGITCLFVLYALWKGEKNAHYLSMARPSDAPREKFFILIPMLTTAAGGVLASLFFGAFTTIGFFSGGWGDAVGEPVGSRWGKHRYSVPSMVGVSAQRSLEGSAAVLVVSAFVSSLALYGMGFDMETALMTGLACGVGSSLVEAFSTHGLDNLTMQVAASGIAWFILHESQVV